MDDHNITMHEWPSPGAAGRAVTMVTMFGLLCSFVAGCLPNREPTAPISIDRPDPRVMSPVPGTLIVPRTTTVRMAFTNPMDLGTFPGHFFLRDLSGNEVVGGYAGSDTTVIFLPQQPLLPSTVYQAALRGRVRNVRRMTVQINNEPVFDDTTLLMSTWFYTEGNYSQNGFYPVFIRDRKEGKVRVYSHLDSELTSVLGFGAPEGMAVTPDGLHLYVTSTTRDSVMIVNTQSYGVERQLPVAQYPSSVVTFGSTAYVMSINGRALTKIDIGSENITAQIPLNFYPARLAITNDGGTLFTLDQGTRDLVLLREADGSVIKRLAGAFTQLVVGDIVVDHSNLYICDAKGLKIKSTDAAGTSFQTVQTYPAGVEPVAMAFSPTVTGEYYVAAGKNIFKCVLSSTVPIDTLIVSSATKAVGVVPSGDILYATYGSNIVIVDVKSFTLLRDIQLSSSGLEGVLASPNRH